MAWLTAEACNHIVDNDRSVQDIQWISEAKQAMKKSNADIYNAWTACSLTKLTETGADSRITLYTKSLDPLQAKNDYQLLYANVRNALQSYAATKPANYYYGTVTRIGGELPSWLARGLHQRCFKKAAFIVNKSVIDRPRVQFRDRENLRKSRV
ncbi:hypothetical protein FBUS_03205 [Fasciolopsis buskii]|uniref:Uncharacterized protein n=1 Tax=Fasciolopsis buskii TaxID=27845 RepID=A0A8E0RNX9_9TREM|nr:hypothetical protein FBUS_03205 [Fasciolopsis buski]